ncbi:hypothetical protein CARUB_v10027480mg [Capsella rubella]|uniref:CCDC22 N-terminal domain-containing protein n=1 Tax=Capsella rubella TaxID=81985 RepID=R0EZB2_9BRAS|nr:hypothetical protein CARUB_v10027480mg [Capsella rubella]
MEESRDILMSTLIESGVFIPGDFSSIGEFSSEALVSICAQLLNLIDPSSASFCDELLILSPIGLGSAPISLIL